MKRRYNVRVRLKIRSGTTYTRPDEVPNINSRVYFCISQSIPGRFRINKQVVHALLCPNNSCPFSCIWNYVVGFKYMFDLKNLSMKSFYYRCYRSTFLVGCSHCNSVDGRSIGWSKKVRQTRNFPSHVIAQFLSSRAIPQHVLSHAGV